MKIRTGQHRWNLTKNIGRFRDCPLQISSMGPSVSFLVGGASVVEVYSQRVAIE